MRPVRIRQLPVEALEMQVEKVTRVQQHEHPQHVGTSLDEFPDGAPQNSLAQIIRCRCKHQSVEQGDDSENVGERESVLHHDIGLPNRMKFVSEQSDQVPFNPTVKDYRGVDNGKHDRVDAAFSSPGHKAVQSGP